MKTGSISSSLCDLIEQPTSRRGSCESEGVSYQQVASELESASTMEPCVSETMAAAATASAEGQIQAPSQAVPSTSGEYHLSTDPIWDTGWEIEPQNPDLGQAAIDSLRGLFSKNGLADSDVKLSYIEELAVCPGVRSWVNRSVVVEYPNGYMEKFSAEWTQKRPEWTLCSMLERLGAEGPVQVVT